MIPTDLLQHLRAPAGIEQARRAAILVVVLHVLVSAALAQAPATGGGTAGNSPPPIPLNLKDQGEVDHFESLRQEIIRQAEVVLARKRDGSSADERLSKRAAGILAMTNVDRAQSLKNIVETIDIRRSGPGTGLDPLDGYFTAKSLIGSRRPATAEAILDTLQEPRTRLEILVRACVLDGLDHRQVIMARIEGAQKQADAAADKPQWHENLRQLRICLTPDYFRDRANWPSRLPDKIHPPEFGEKREDSLDPPIERFPPEKIDIRDNTQMYFFGQLCRSVEYHCVVALLAWHQGRSTDKDLALTAARLLKQVAIRDSAYTLCLTMTLREPLEGEPKDPLDGFPAAQALAASGRTDVADELIRHLRGPYPPSDQEVLLGAHVLRKLDRSEIMLVRIGRTPTNGPLQQIESWLKTPGFFDNPANWPSRMPQK